jgi:dephospho-CoA kinase
MILVGLTGGIGSGKSTVSAMLAERGALVIDADLVTREVQQPAQPLLAKLAERFGDVLTPDGALDRVRLAAIAFADDQALKDLNAIVHPVVRAEIMRRVRELRDTDRLVVLDVPLLVEGHTYGARAIVVVDTPVDVAVQRLVMFRGMSEADARARIGRQATREERLAVADRVIDNSGDEAALAEQVDEVWTWMQSVPPVPPRHAGDGDDRRPEPEPAPARE